jgi:hypothetical protein
VRDAFIDVMLEVPVSELARLHDPTAALYERMREGADAKCAEVGARLRTDRAPEVRVQQADHPLLGGMTLVASRWAVVAPDSVVASA